MSTVGVDGATELIAELDRQSDTSLIALKAPRSSSLYRYLSEGLRSGPNYAEFTNLTIQLIQRTSIWWSAEAYTSLPVIVPWCIRDRACRYDQGPEAWGSPRSDGYLRDDNSIIKKLPLPISISSPEGSAYHGRKLWRGFTACHIWRDLPDGELAGADPWLYSFIPNLVWLPSWLAPLTDRQGGDVQAVLQRTSIALFGSVRVLKPLSKYAENAWRKLPDPHLGMTLQIQQLSKFDPPQAFFVRRLRYLDKFVQGCDDVLNNRPVRGKLICSRYTEGLPTLEHDEIRRFRDTLDTYRNACSASLAELG